MARTLSIIATALLGLVVGVGSLAAAGKPTIERFDVDRTQADPGLTARCGVPVDIHIQGHVVVRTFPAGGTGPVELVTLNLALTAIAGDNTYSFRSVGVDNARVQSDGTTILISTGQFPFTWTGAVKINLDTGETLLEPNHSLEGNGDEACAALTA